MSKKISAYAYGVIPLFKTPAGWEILLIKNANGHHWGFPKGTPEADETPLATATRELFEETGLRDLKIYPEVNFTETYDFTRAGIDYAKTNIFYLGLSQTKTCRPAPGEIEDIKWVTPSQAQTILTHQSALSVLSDLTSYLANSAL